ncbi:MAG: hypothetical protein K2N55_11480, partial [Lachnospiraceae bacterium]|nr:hypothetical protein [Lachnospiraceae bacterium]
MNLKTGKNKEPAENKSVNIKKKKRRILKKGEKAGMRKMLIGLIILLGVMLAAVIAVVVFFFASGKKGEDGQNFQGADLSELAEEIAEEMTKEDMGEGVVDHLVTAGSAVWESFHKRPETHELAPDMASEFASISQCIIDPDTKRISVTVEGDGVPKSDDKYYYLFALNTYDSGIAEGSDYIARDYKDNATSFGAALNYNLSSSRLYKKFVVAIKKDGQYVQVSGPSYITNPEAIARYSSVYQQASSKKGLLVDPNRLRGNELDDLGVKQAAYNIPVARLLGPTTSAAYPTIHYT